MSLLWEDTITIFPEKIDLKLQQQLKIPVCFVLVFPFKIFWGDSQTEQSTPKLLSSDKTKIYCFKATSLLVWLGCLFLRPVSFSFWLACESRLYYCSGYSYGGHQNILDGYKFWVVPDSLAALCCVLAVGIVSPDVKMTKASVQRIGTQCTKKGIYRYFHRLYLYAL